ncbi:TetR/AcrR family transcriptional regulator [Solibacillus silvestris]
MSHLNEKDPRVIRTRNTFKEVFASLIKQKSYKDVTVTNIIEVSGYNRATFYGHFKGKEELCEWLIQDELAGLERALRFPFHFTGTIEFEKLTSSSVKVFEYVKEHYLFFDLLIEFEKVPGLDEALIKMIHESFLNTIQFSSNFSNEEIDYHFNIYRAYGIFGLIVEWVRNKYEPSVNVMTEHLINIMNAYTPKASTKKNE